MVLPASTDQIVEIFPDQTDKSQTMKLRLNDLLTKTFIIWTDFENWSEITIQIQEMLQYLNGYSYKGDIFTGN